MTEFQPELLAEMGAAELTDLALAEGGLFTLELAARGCVQTALIVNEVHMIDGRQELLVRLDPAKVQTLNDHATYNQTRH